MAQIINLNTFNDYRGNLIAYGSIPHSFAAVNKI